MSDQTADTPPQAPTDQRIAELEDWVVRWQARARDAERLLKAAEARVAQQDTVIAHWTDCHGVTADRLAAAEARVAQVTSEQERWRAEAERIRNAYNRSHSCQILEAAQQRVEDLTAALATSERCRAEDGMSAIHEQLARKAAEARVEQLEQRIMAATTEANLAYESEQRARKTGAK